MAQSVRGAEWGGQGVRRPRRASARGRPNETHGQHHEMASDVTTSVEGHVN